jgi:hypothetical protein
MASQAVQELVKKIFGDDRTKLQFISDPESFLSQSGLTEQEKRAMMDTHTELGLVESNSGQLKASIGPMSGWF